ncbi:hypothetical protein [Hymenobacter radiodurans]|uniref:hypothetical protein n=1 Tax=Hymenobacter radiodurans TaxID=2496028 RepID=UPI0014055DC2|nr:hypothetical protein [Hymenobacter radiodurans]
MPAPSFDPSQLTRDHVLRALRHIDRQGLNLPPAPSTTWCIGGGATRPAPWLS